MGRVGVVLTVHGVLSHAFSPGAHLTTNLYVLILFLYGLPPKRQAYQATASNAARHISGALGQEAWLNPLSTCV